MEPAKTSSEQFGMAQSLYQSYKLQVLFEVELSMATKFCSPRDPKGRLADGESRRLFSIDKAGFEGGMIRKTSEWHDNRSTTIGLYAGTHAVEGVLSDSPIASVTLRLSLNHDVYPPRADVSIVVSEGIRKLYVQDGWKILEAKIFFLQQIAYRLETVMIVTKNLQKAVDAPISMES